MSHKDNAETIVTAIREAFLNVSRGNGISLHEADAIDDHASDDQRRRAKTLDTDSHWWEIRAEQLEKLYNSLAFMDAEGFRYYIPAYMTQALKTCTTGSLTIDATLVALFPATEEAASKFDLLDASQKESIARFLWFIATQPSNGRDNKLEVYNATRALEDIWYPHLS